MEFRDFWYIACDARRKIAGFAMLRLAADEAELITIAVDPRRLASHGDVVPIQFSLLPQLLNHPPRQRIEVHRPLRELQRAERDTAYVEKLVHERGHLTRLALQHFRRLLHSGVGGRRIAQDGRAHRDRRQRIA